jgi:hypothetical protein
MRRFYTFVNDVYVKIIIKNNIQQQTVICSYSAAA